MANIFKRSIVKEKAEKQQVADLAGKAAIVQSWYDAYKNGDLQKKNERQCEQEFINDIFKQVLGYTGFPTQPHTLIPQIASETSAQRPDVGLGYFDNVHKRVFAVVEIKDVNTSLDQSQRREGNLSPIQQAFKYKPQFKDCRFVIATNIYEIRLFQENQLDYEIFTLKSLSDSTNNHFELRKFILLMGADNFVSGRGKSKTEELLAEIRIEQEKITNAFYKEYSDLRLLLMRDIWKNNKGRQDIHLVADKAQKILDRIVFTCFCEDTGLLPEGILQKVFKHAEDSVSSTWDSLKGFFHAVDGGSEKLGIPDGYNGGLFHEDTDLDALKISDEACKALGAIGRYDFENELSVNILGHVFEQSITDLEEIKKKVEPDEDSQKSKRKKDGIFYTPEYIVDHIVQSSLGRYLRENEERIFNEHKLDLAKTEKAYREREQKALYAYQEFLTQIKVVDPACGSGAFLVRVFDYLLKEHQRVGSQLGGLFDQEQIYRDILKENIYGVDLNEESIRITQLSLWLKTAQKGKKLTYLDKNIKCGNSLIENIDVAGDRAFNWQNEFTEVFNRGGFDVVVGNPPYVRPEYVDRKERDYYIKAGKYKFTFGRFDLYLVFLELATQVLKPQGYLSFILPSSFFNQNYARLLREELLENYYIQEIVDLSDTHVFDGVSVQTGILVIKKSKLDNYVINVIKTKGDVSQISALPKEQITSQFYKTNAGFMFRTDVDGLTMNILKKIRERSNDLQLYCYVVIGAVPHDGSTGESKDRLISKVKTQSSQKPYIEGKDVERYLIKWRGLYLDYQPHMMHRPKFPELFENKKILVRNISTIEGLVATYDDLDFYCNDTLSVCIPWCLLSGLERRGIGSSQKAILMSKGVTAEALLGVINSKPINFYFKKLLSSNLHVYPEAIRSLPIPRDVALLQIDSVVRQILTKRKEYLDNREKFQALLQDNKKELICLPNSWQLQDWTGFKKIIGFSEKQADPRREEALYDRYLRFKKEAESICSEIASGENSIDQKIYDYLGLSDDEIEKINKPL